MGLFGTYEYKSKNGEKYYLHVKERGNSRVYYFSKEQDGAEEFLPPGFEVVETTREAVGKKMYVTKKVTKLVAPDTGALKFALTNYDPDRYRIRKEVKVDAPAPLELVINTGKKEIVEKD